MKNSNSNLEFHYLHRDEGNYKIHGSIIFKNPHQLSPADATKLFSQKLIDGEYFYPKEVKIPIFEEHSGLGDSFTDWYEFSQFSLTEKTPTDPRTIEDILHNS